MHELTPKYLVKANHVTGRTLMSSSQGESGLVQHSRLHDIAGLLRSYFIIPFVMATSVTFGLSLGEYSKSTLPMHSSLRTFLAL